MAACVIPERDAGHADRPESDRSSEDGRTAQTAGKLVFSLLGTAEVSVGLAGTANTTLHLSGADDNEDDENQLW